MVPWDPTLQSAGSTTRAAEKCCTGEARKRKLCNHGFLCACQGGQTSVHGGYHRNCPAMDLKQETGTEKYGTWTQTARLWPAWAPKAVQTAVLGAAADVCTDINARRGREVILSVGPTDGDCAVGVGSSIAGMGSDVSRFEGAGWLEGRQEGDRRDNILPLCSVWQPIPQPPATRTPALPPPPLAMNPP